MIIRDTLSNNIQLVMESVESVRSVSFGIYIKNGSVDETLENNGISHFIEHMLFKGTPTYSAKDIADIMSRLGGRLNAYTSKEYVCFYAHVLEDHLYETIDLLADMLQNSSFLEKDIQKEKGIILEEYAMYEDNPEEVVLDELHALNWPNASLGYNIIGTKENIKNFNQSTITNYYTNHYNGENMVISIVGKIEPKECIDYLEKAFSKTQKGIKVERSGTLACKSGIKSRSKDMEQSHIAMSFPAPDYYDDDHYAISILSTIVGGGLNSRLFQKIREEKGLAYSIYTYTESFYATGLFTTYAATSTEQVQQVYESIQEEYELLREEGIEKKELVEAKEQIKSNLIIGMENMSSRMSHYGKGILLKNSIKDQDELIQLVDAVTIDKMNQLIADTIVFDTLSIAVASPNKDILCHIK